MGGAGEATDGHQTNGRRKASDVRLEEIDTVELELIDPRAALPGSISLGNSASRAGSSSRAVSVVTSPWRFFGVGNVVHGGTGEGGQERLLNISRPP
jgi:hypothetical protein